MRMADLQHGWDVLSNDGHKIGRIREVSQHYIEVNEGLFSGPLYVPASAIANVEPGRVHLNLARGEVDAMDWQQPPRSPDDLRTSPERDVEREI